MNSSFVTGSCDVRTICWLKIDMVTAVFKINGHCRKFFCSFDNSAEKKKFGLQLFVLQFRPSDRDRAWSNILKYLRRENAVCSVTLFKVSFTLAEDCKGTFMSLYSGFRLACAIYAEKTSPKTCCF